MKEKEILEAAKGLVNAQILSIVKNGKQTIYIVCRNHSRASEIAKLTGGKVVFAEVFLSIPEVHELTEIVPVSVWEFATALNEKRYDGSFKVEEWYGEYQVKGSPFKVFCYRSKIIDRVLCPKWRGESDVDYSHRFTYVVAIPL